MFGEDLITQLVENAPNNAFIMGFSTKQEQKMSNLHAYRGSIAEFVKRVLLHPLGVRNIGFRTIFELPYPFYVGSKESVAMSKL